MQPREVRDFSGRKMVLLHHLGTWSVLPHSGVELNLGRAYIVIYGW